MRACVSRGWAICDRSAHIRKLTSRSEVDALVGLINNLLQHGRSGRHRGDKNKHVRRDVNAVIHAAADEAYRAKCSAGTTAKGAVDFIHDALERRGINTDENVDRVFRLIAHPSRVRVSKNNT